MPILRKFAEARSVSFQDVWGKGGIWAGGLATASGRRVDRSTSLKYSTAYACISLIADTWGSLPIGQFRNGEDDSRVKVPRSSWLVDPSGVGDTTFSLAESLSVSFSVGGNYYGEVITSPHTAEPERLFPLDPSRVTPHRSADGDVVFDVLLDTGETKTVRRYRRGRQGGILHIPGLRMPGALAGLAPLELAREAIGLGLTAEEYGARFFQNGARPDLVITLPEGTKATTEVIERLKFGWTSHHQGVANSHKPGVLSDGASLKEITIPPEHAQFLETREFQQSDVASWFRVPPHMVGLVSKSTSWGSGLEEQSSGFARYTLTPPIRRAELALSQILPDGEFVRWILAGLERASLEKRYAAYAVGRNGGWLSANDIRRLEDQDPIDGGDEYLVPMNMNLATDPNPGEKA